MAVIALATGNHEAAEPHFRRALRKPGGRTDPRLYANLGACLGRKGDYRGAEAAYRQSIRLEPSARRWHELGTALALQLKFAAARQAFTKAIALEPSALAWYALSTAQRGLEQWDDAARSCREAIKLKPDFPEAIATLSSLLCRRWEHGDTWDVLDEAIEAAEAACFHDLTWDNLSTVAVQHQLAGHWEEALETWDKLLDYGAISPHNRALRSMIPLIRGEFEEGFREYQYIFESHLDRSIYPTDRPRWDGRPTDGAIVVCSTHGYGDCFHFIRYAKLLRERCSRVIVAALSNSGHHHAASVLARCPGVDEVITDYTQIPEHDAWAPIMSLPDHFGTPAEMLLGAVPYLTADPAAIDRWRPFCGGLPGFKVGICFRGDPRNNTDPRRSYPPELLAPLADVPGVTLIALQMGRDDEIEHLPIRPVPDRMSWMDTAAIMAQLDLVIAPDTGLTHLAGAMGVPTWVVLSDPADWRWLLDRDDSPWYPSVRLFRQKPRGAWPEVFSRIEAALRSLVSCQLSVVS